MKDNKTADAKLAEPRIVSRRLCGTGAPPGIPSRPGRIIRRAQTAGQARTVRVIGGDCVGDHTGPPPTIIIEKTDDEMVRRILVKCPCGREAELWCEAEEPT